jgi:two-component system cell cycle sensor histidine kinase/response regulator CckA
MPRPIALVAVAIASAMALAGWLFARREVDNRLAAMSAELGTVAALKALQLSEWHRERTDDALGRAADPLFVASVREWLAGNQSPGLAERLQGSLTPRREPWRYLNVWLLDLNGGRIFDARRSGGAADVDAELFARCRDARRPVFGRLRALDTASPFLDLCMVVADLGALDAPAAMQLYRADASQLMLPTIRFFTQSDNTVITDVVRFDAGVPQLVVSSARQAAAESPVIVPAGFLTPQSPERDDSDVTGRDGVRRLVATRTVKDTSWTVIVGRERRDVLRGAYDDVALTSALALALGLAGYLSFVVVLQRRERETARQTLRLDRLLQVRSAINEAIVRIRDRQVMLSRFCELAVALGHFELAAVYEWQHDKQSARLVASSGDLPERLIGGTEIEVGAVVREGPVRALFEGQVAIVPDLRAEPPTPWTQQMFAAGTRALVALPIREDGRITASFWMYSREPGVFDRRDIQFFNELAGDISYALENVRADLRRGETELQLNAVFEAAPFAMFLIGCDDGRIIRANAAAVRQYGFDEGELSGETAARIFRPADLAPGPSLNSGGEPLPLTATHHRKDGTSLTVEISNRSVVVAGRPCDIVIAVDVTARRQLEEQFLQAQRLEAIGRLAGGVAHDFNNLLTVIAGFAAMLLEDVAEDPAARRSAEQIQIAARRASELTKSLLAFSRRQVLQPQDVRLNDMIRETATMLSRMISEDIVLRLQLDATADTVNVDPSQMQQVLMNLAVNARDAMARGGRLTLSTRDIDSEVELRVSDTGTGIAPEARAHLFEPFFTTKPPGEGTGLGLPTVHGIVTQSGGTISVETELGRGTTFVIVLPRGARESAPEAPSPRPAARRAGKGTVMLVEDDEGVRSLATLILQRGGYSVTAYANGAAALDQLASGLDSVDLVLTDVVMPGMSGPELVRLLRTYYPALPVVYMSGYAEEAAARLEIDTRTLDLLHKPFAPQELLRRVDAALGVGLS